MGKCQVPYLATRDTSRSMFCSLLRHLCAHEDLSYIPMHALVVLFRGSRRAATKTCHTYVATYSYPFGVLVVRQRLCTCRGSGYPLGTSCAHKSAELIIMSTRNTQEVRLHLSLPLFCCTRPLNQFTRAYPSFGCFHVISSALTAEAVVVLVTSTTQRCLKSKCLNHK